MNKRRDSETNEKQGLHPSNPGSIISRWTMPWAFHFLQPQRSHLQDGHNLNGNVKILTKSLAMSRIFDKPMLLFRVTFLCHFNTMY